MGNVSIQKLRNVAADINNNSPSGVFVLEPEPKEELQKAVSELEAICGPPSEEFRKSMIGDWKLLCTMNTPKFATSSISSKTKFKIPDFFKNPVQEKITESVEVTQRIRCIEDDNYIDRVDNIIEFTPFSLDDLISSASLNLNPFEVTKTKVTLAHKAEVQSIKPVLRTKIALQSVILTVAGSSQYLDAQGADILGVNLPLGDFLNAGSFDTTYVDEDIRISRGSAGLFDQLRVFVRKDSSNESVLDAIDEEGEQITDNIIVNEVADEVEPVESIESVIEEVKEELDSEVSIEDESLEDSEITDSDVSESVEETPDDADDDPEAATDEDKP